MKLPHCRQLDHCEQHSLTVLMRTQSWLKTLGAPFLIRDGSGAARNEWVALEAPVKRQSLPFAVVPRQDMPSAFNPEQGFLVNANNDPSGLLSDNDLFDQLRPGGGLDYLLAFSFSMRAGKIKALIEERLGPGQGSFDRQSQGLHLTGPALRRSHSQSPPGVSGSREP